jgi:hypothetical protein
MPEVRVSDSPVCDFCSSPEPRYLEDCETFEAWAMGHPSLPPALIGRSEGAWSACMPCHEMIQARKWAALQRRAVDALCRKWPEMPRSRVQKGVELIHGQFRAHKPVEGLNP